MWKDLKTDNLAVTTGTLLPATNLKTVNFVFLDLLTSGRDSLTGADILDITPIAQQCPLEGGPAVSIARSLLSLHQPNLYYDDGADCIVGNNSIQLGNGTTIPPQGFSLYPNPANHSIELQLESELEIDAGWTIHDLHGRITLSGIIPEGTLRIDVNISVLAAGTYYLRMSNDLQHPVAHKFIKN